MADVAFKEGTASAYSKITPDSHTFYHTTDDDQVYLGEILLCGRIKARMLYSYTPQYQNGSLTYGYSTLSTNQQRRFSHTIAVFSSLGDYAIGNHIQFIRDDDNDPPLLRFKIEYHYTNIDSTEIPDNVIYLYQVYYDV